jgi:hypothetical protein
MAKRRRSRGGSVQIEWNTKKLDTGLQSFGQAGKDLPYKIAQYYVPQVEREAKQNADWVDRTGNARQGLYGRAVELEPGAAAILLIHSMEYGVHLELGFQGRYAIIGPTLESYYPKVRQMLKDVTK